MRLFIKRKKEKIAALILGVVFITISFRPFLAYAQDNKPKNYQIVQLDKGKVRLNIAPGEAQSGIIKVTNPSDQPKEVKVHLADWAYQNNDGFKLFYPMGTRPLSAFQWINFSPVEFTVPPYGKEYVNYIVRVPEDAKGGHYAVLFFEGTLAKDVPMALPEGQGVSAPVTFKVRVGSLFYIEPKGTIVRDISLGNLNLNKKDNLLEISADLQNTGNVDLLTEGTFNIIDKKGSVYARGKFNPVFTLQDEPAAKLTSTWDKPLPKGVYDLIITIDIGKAQAETGFAGGPIVTKEAKIEIGEDGKVIKVGELK